MVRSKRKWKKDSPEKLEQRIDKEVQLRKQPIDAHKQIKSPENKKSKSSDIVPSDSSSDAMSEPALVINKSPPQTGNQFEPDLNEMDPVDEIDNENTQSNTEGSKNDGESEQNSEDKPPIESALSDITRALTALTQTVATISINMVSKRDISCLEEVITKQGSQITENAEKLKTVMTREEGEKIERKVKDHDTIIESHANNIENIEGNVSEVNKKVLDQVENEKTTSKRIDGLAESTNKIKTSLHSEINEMKQKLREQDAEIQMLKNGQKVATAQNTVFPRVNQQENFPQPDQYDTRLNIIIEGLQENEGEDLLEKIKGLFAKLDVKIDPDDISSAWRLTRRTPIGKKPNPVKICFSNGGRKEQIMRAKWKLKHQAGTEHIWINHDEPTVIRRAKGRARHIASYSRKKGSQAQITSRGIVLDSVFYSYENLDKIPSIYIPPASLQYPIQVGTSGTTSTTAEEHTQNPVSREQTTTGGPRPMTRPIDSIPSTPLGTQNTERKTQSPKIPRTKKPQRMRLTRSGLVYSGPSAILSHLYKATFTIDDTPYNSVEQKLQYEKAMMANDEQAAETIMNTQDTWKIKQIGDKVKVTQEYIDNRLHIARIGNEAKYRDNLDLMDVLLDTGELILIEGATSSFWAGGEPYDSLAYDNEDSHGKNHQGIMLMNLRTNERMRRARIA